MPKVIEVEPVMIAGEVVVTVPLQNDKAPQAPHMYAAVSYTHLTLPTKRIV